jgi:ubiquitin carboxyl-terminal hydrolase 22/27/51
MAGYRQQDAHEYFQFLVNGLHSCTPGHAESYDKQCTCFFHQMFYGELRSSVMCHKCGQTTNTHDPMADLSLDIQLQNKKRKLGRATTSSTANLIGCLESFTAPEDLHADAAYHCEKCGNTPQRASKRLQIRKLPVILCMQLKVRIMPLTLSHSHSNFYSAMSTPRPHLRRWMATLISP